MSTETPRETAPRPYVADSLPAPRIEESAVLRIVRDALRLDPPAVRFVRRDLRLPQL